MFLQKRNAGYISFFLICFCIFTVLILNSCGRLFLNDDGVENKSIEELSDVSSLKIRLDGLNTTISEITQTVGSDGLFSGSFVVPEDGISFLLSIFLGSNSNIKFYSLTDPSGTDILSISSNPNLRGF